ncbi:hypothetical protein HMPREF0262_02877 [Clostridium sp. ATCC 29733]|nr:hypothetical protein HMPREF0262_02877 [Clostridium sp. ATCC 29733]
MAGWGKATIFHPFSKYPLTAAAKTCIQVCRQSPPALAAMFCNLADWYFLIGGK